MPTATNKRTEYTYDWTLAAAVAALLVMGLIMVFSSSYMQGIDGYDSPYYFIVRQLLWAAVGLAALVTAARIPYQIWERWSIPLMGIALIALMAVIFLGSTRYGANRTFFSGSVQPSEAAKIVIIMYISAWLASKGERIKQVHYGLIPFSVLMGVVAGLVVAQPDISTAVLIIATACVLFFVAGAELRQLLVIALLTGITLWLVITQSSYAGERIDAYLNSTENPLASESWQIRNTVQSVTLGGPIGVGLGNGEMKSKWIPLSWSDNIFAVIGEESGLLGSLLFLLLFAIFAYRGFQIALTARDNFGMLMATGVTALLILQALLNIAVVLALAPPTGVPLPFVSFGGSSLVTSMAAVGILLSISRYGHAQPGRAPAAERTRYALFDRRGGDRRSRLSSPGRRRPTTPSPRNNRRGKGSG